MFHLLRSGTKISFDRMEELWKLTNRTIILLRGYCILNPGNGFVCFTAPKRLLVSGLLCAAVLLGDAPSKPKLISVFPSGGQAGSEFEIRLRGTSLEGAYAAWFDAPGLSGVVEKVAAIDSPSKKDKDQPPYEVVLAVAIDDSMQSGAHRLRLVTPHGLSDALVFRVHTEPGLLEAEGEGSENRLAGSLSSFPIVVHGRIDEKGQIDDYELEVQSGQELLFEADSGTALMDPTLTILAPTGSWLNPGRLTRLAYNDEPIHFPGYSSDPRMKYRFQESGRYILRVGTFLGPGSADYIYQLRVAPITGNAHTNPHRTRHRPSQSDSPLWEERSFTRELGPDRMQALWSRSVKPAVTDSESGESAESGEAEAHFVGPIPVTKVDSTEDTVPVTLPALIEGSVERAGDIDRVQFEAKRGDKVVLEIDTADATVPDFNPFLKVVDENDVEVFTNIHSNLNNNGGFIMKTVQPKTVFTFLRDGRFTLEIRDITTQEADDRFSYRVILRPQVPHLGTVHIGTKYLNLVPDETRKVSIRTDQEEGFDGYIALQAVGLPEGVQAIMGTEVEPNRPPPLNDGKIDRYRAKSQLATMLFVAAPDAPATRMPSKVHIMARPVLDGKMGPAILAKELLLMVIRPPEIISSAGGAEEQVTREE